MISVLITVKNEVDLLPGCLESVRWADDVFVVDSGSDDGTRDIVVQFGGRHVEHPFVNSAAQKNWALGSLDFTNSWILVLDADERISDDLAVEVRSAVLRDECDGFWIPRKNFFGGKWIRHGGWHPDWTLRLVRRGRGEYEDRAVHSELQVKGRVAFLESPIIHLSRSTIADHLEHYNRYSSLESEELYRRGGKRREVRLISLPGAMRPLGVRLWSCLPCKPFWTFFWHYVFRGGFRDSSMGAILAAMEAYNVAITHAKRWEREHRDVVDWKVGPGIGSPEFSLRTLFSRGKRSGTGRVGRRITVALRIGLRRFLNTLVALDTRFRSLLHAGPAPGTSRILAVHLFGLGDLVMASPSLRGLRELFGGSFIVLMVREECRELAEMIPGPDGVISIPVRPSDRTRDGGNHITIKILLSYFKVLLEIRRQHFDLVFCPFTGLANTFWAYLSGARDRVGYLSGFHVSATFRHHALSRSYHPIDMGIDVLRVFESDRIYSRCPLLLDGKRARDSTVAGLSPKEGVLVGLNPASRAPSRQWPPEAWVELAARLVTRFDATVVLTGEERSREFNAAIRDAVRANLQERCIDRWGIDRIVDLAGKTSVRELVGLLSMLDLYITPDSGPMHIALAMETPVLAIFGPTDPCYRIHEASFANFITPDLRCSPCYQGEYEPLCRNHECMKAITVDMVWERVEALLQKYVPSPSG